MNDFVILIPTHNEEKRIYETMVQLQNYLTCTKYNYHILVVDDGTDQTKEIASWFLNTSIIHFNKKQGKGGAVTKGLKHLSEENIVILFDADAATPPIEIPKILKALETSDVAIGSRYKKGSHISRTPIRRFFGESFNYLVRQMFHLPYKDTQCGFKAFKMNSFKPVLNKLSETGFTWDVEMLYLSKKYHLKVTEVPVVWTEKIGGTIKSNIFSLIKTSYKMFKELRKLKNKIKR